MSSRSKSLAGLAKPFNKRRKVVANCNLLKKSLFGSAETKQSAVCIPHLKWGWKLESERQFGSWEL